MTILDKHIIRTFRKNDEPASEKQIHYVKSLFLKTKRTVDSANRWQVGFWSRACLPDDLTKREVNMLINLLNEKPDVKECLEKTAFRRANNHPLGHEQHWVALFVFSEACAWLANEINAAPVTEEGENTERDMIRLCRGNLLEADVDAWVNPVNCADVSGVSINLQFKITFPENERACIQACRDGEMRLGKVLAVGVYRKGVFRYVVNFPTRHHWQDQSNLQSIQDGLADLVRWVTEKRIGSIAIPALGCGSGLNWLSAKWAIEQAFDDVACEVFLYEPR